MKYEDKKVRNEQNVKRLRDIEKRQIQYMGDLDLEYAEMMVDKGKGEKWVRYLHELGYKSTGFLKLVTNVLKNEESIKIIEEEEMMEHYKLGKTEFKTAGVQTEVKMDKKKV